MAIRAAASAPTHTLAGCDVFHGVAPATREAFERRCTWHWWNKGAMAIDADGTEASVHFVVAGRAQVQIQMQGGRHPVVVDEIGPGGFFGEMAAIDGEPRSATVIARERTLTAEIDGDTFLAFITAHPAAALLLMRRLTEVIRQADRAILEISGLDTQTRICVELLRRARTGGALPPNTAIIEPVPRTQDIAARVSTARETVARTLGTLQRRRLLTREPGRILIHDLAALTALAHDTPA